MNQNPNEIVGHQTSPTSRREFLKTSSAAALGGVLAANVVFPEKSFAANRDTIKIGLIGCGGRGNGAAADALAADSNTVLYAMGDIDAAKIEVGLREVGKSVTDTSRIQVPAERRFVGLDAYKKVIDSDLDVVLLTTPPGFRPQHFQAAVAAGKHAFLEKPIATDAAGVRSVRASAVEAKRKGLAVQSGFCWRANTSRIEFYQRLHHGAIGEVRSLYHTYLTGPVKPMPPATDRPAGMSDVEWQIRNWYNFIWLCGDGLVEQAIHSIDKLIWSMQDLPPLKCTAVGGRQTPNHEGNIYDHFEVNYIYPNGARAFIANRQIVGCYNENSDYILGADGTCTIGRGPVPRIEGKTNWTWNGERYDMYQREHDLLFAAIRKNQPINDGKRL